MLAPMLPSLDDAYPLSPLAIREYREQGHVVLRGLASPAEVAAYRPAIVETGPRGLFDHRPLAERDTYGKAFLQMFNLWTHDARVRAFVFARRFARAAAELMGVDGVRLYHDQALFKEPGGGYTPWHQDQFYWPLDTPHTITMWMPLVAVTRRDGPDDLRIGLAPARQPQRPPDQRRLGGGLPARGRRARLSPARTHGALRRRRRDASTPAGRCTARRRTAASACAR